MELLKEIEGKSLFSSNPLGISKYIVPEMKTLIGEKMQTKKYDCVFFNLLAMYSYCDYIKEIDPQIKATALLRFTQVSILQ